MHTYFALFDAIVKISLFLTPSSHSVSVFFFCNLIRNWIYENSNEVTQYMLQGRERVTNSQEPLRGGYSSAGAHHTWEDTQQTYGEAPPEFQPLTI